MARFNLKSLLKGYKKAFGMTAEIFNENGDLLDSVDLKKKRFSSKFDLEDALGDARKGELTIKLIDNNGADPNFTRKGGRSYDLESDEQTFTTSIKKKQQSKTIKLSPETDEIDTQKPIFKSGQSVSVDENIDPEVVIYKARAKDSSPVTFSIKGGDASAFSIDPNTGAVKFKESPDAEEKLSYSFKVVATDSNNNKSSQRVSVAVNDLEDTGQTITLSRFEDIYDQNNGTQIRNNVQTPQQERLTKFDDVINGAPGDYGQSDSLTDPSTEDNDTANIITNDNFELEEALDNIVNITNIENMVVQATEDDSSELDFTEAIELKKLVLKGSWDTSGPLEIFGWIDTANITNFDFSEVTTDEGFEVDTDNNFVEEVTSRPLTFTGSRGPDALVASIGPATMKMGAGDDYGQGSLNDSTYFEGGEGFDEVDLVDDNNATDTVSYKGITSELNFTDIDQGFVGFLNTAQNPNQNVHDLLEFDADTVTNFTAGTTVQQKTFDQLENILGTARANNHMLVDEDVLDYDLSEHGESWVALDLDSGELYFAQDGNFEDNGVAIGEIDFASGGSTADFLSDRNVVVV